MGHPITGSLLLFNQIDRGLVSALSLSHKTTVGRQTTIETPAEDQAKMSADIKAAKKVTLKVGFLTVAVSAIGILDPPIQKKPDDGNPSLLLIAYLLVVSTIFSMGLFLLLLSLILPRMPSLVPAVKILVWVDLILLHIALTLKLGIQVIY